MEADWSQLMSFLISGRSNIFAARVVIALQVRDNTRIPYAAVHIENRHYILSKNPNWLKSTSFDDAVATMEHEVFHIVLEHLPRTLKLRVQLSIPEEIERFDRCYPVATDMACNCVLAQANKWVSENRDEWVFPNTPPFNFPLNRTFEMYLRWLMDRDRDSEESEKRQQQRDQQQKEEEQPSGQQQQQQQQQPGNDGDGGKFHQFMKNLAGQNTFKLLDNHKLWQDTFSQLTNEEMAGLADELAAKGKQVVQQAVKDHQKSRGLLPAFLQELIEKLLAPPTVSWLRLLRNYVVNTKRWKWKRSVARPNRRKVGITEFGVLPISPFPGRTKDRSFTCAFCLDTSGSMGQRELEQALNELQHMQKADRDIEIHVIECDAAIGREYLLRANDEVKYKLTGRGGTVFDPALKRARELKPDICFYYTDGYASAPEVSNRVACPMVWLISPNGKVPDPNWGYQLKMKDR